jgi:hypothetical protein
MTGPSFLEAGFSSSELPHAAIINKDETTTAIRMMSRVECERVDGNIILFFYSGG